MESRSSCPACRGGPGVSITPLRSPARPPTSRTVDDAVSRGAHRGHHRRAQSAPLVLRPVVYPVTRDMRLASEEQFSWRFRHGVRPMTREVIRQVVRLAVRSAAEPVWERTRRASGPFHRRVHNQSGHASLNCQCQRGPDVPSTATRRTPPRTLSVANAHASPSHARRHQDDPRQHRGPSPS